MLLSFEQALDARRKLARLVCSFAWLEKIIAPDKRGNWHRHDVYPQGKNGTMRLCRGCKRICPPNPPHSVCCDCEVEQAERRFDVRLGQEEIDTDGLQELWWHRPLHVLAFIDSPAQDADDPWQVLRAAEEARESEDERTIRLRDLMEAPAGDEDSRRWSDRRVTETITRFRLGLKSPGLRLYDPIPRSSLSRLPEDVAAEILSIVQRWDRVVVASVRETLRELRRACRPLGDFRIFRRQGDVILQHDGRQLCLLRYGKDVPARSCTPESGRAIGCCMLTLSEDKVPLEREIAYFRKHGWIVPSAVRVDGAGRTKLVAAGRNG